MFRMGRHCIWIAAVVAAGLALAPVAHAGGYAGNKCVSKKQKDLGKYAKSVGKAWKKYPADAVSRDTDILKAFTKLDTKWDKNEASAVKKNASCDESTSTSTDAAAIVDAAFLALVGEDQEAVAGYVSGAMKAWSKHIKDPVKDLGKVKLTEGLNKASAKFLTGANGTVLTGASTLEADLVEATTTAPNYPTTFQSITYTPPETVEYGKKTLSPSCVDGDPYTFWARKGTTNNVLVYYQGGGACWDGTSCHSVPGSTCTRTSGPGTSNDPNGFDTGFSDYDNPANPFSDWNVVFVSYCTCDVHWGDNIKAYGPGMVDRHVGRVNAQVAEKFAREHFIDPERVFVTGVSAGSYGAIMNSYWLMKEVWPNADYSVLGDAGVGVITQGFLDNYMVNWGVEKNFPEDLPGVALPITNLSLVDLVDGLAQAYPNNRFANYDTSYDGGGGSQCNFFQVMRHPSPPNSFIADWGSWWESACEWNACMRDFKAENASRASNYHYYTAAGTRHTVFGSDKVYTETKNTKADGAPVTLVDWVTAMIDDGPDWVDIDCNHLGGDCNLTNSCQGGVNAGDVCTVNGDCNSGGCQGGANDGLPCTSNGDCPDGFCPFCQHDPDTANPPFNNDDTVNCAPTICPCGIANAKCVGGANEGLVCTVDGDCPSGTCVWVRCPE